MMCKKRGDSENKQYVLKYMDLNELTTNKANGAQREAEERVRLSRFWILFKIIFNPRKADAKY